MNVGVVRQGIETQLNDGILSRVIFWDGLGVAEIRRLNERGPLQHGENDIGFFLEPRIFTLGFGILGATPGELDTKRAALEDLLRAGKSPLTFKFYYEDGSALSLDAHFYSGLNMARDDLSKQRYQRAAAMFRAPDPTFYVPAGVALSFSLGGGADTFAVPTVIPNGIGASTIDLSNQLNYAGTFRSFPQIRITGPITNCIIGNDTTGEVLDFTGFTISGGDWRDIDCRYGYKTVKDSAGANKISELTKQSDLATFHIADNDEVGSGINSIRVRGTGITAVTKIDITYFIRHIRR